MDIFFLGVWEIPISSYLLFYILLGSVGFLVCYWNRYFLALIIPIVGWFVIGDFQDFYRYNVGPPADYLLQVVLSMVFAVAAPLIGAIVSKRKIRVYKEA